MAAFLKSLGCKQSHQAIFNKRLTNISLLQNNLSIKMSTFMTGNRPVTIIYMSGMNPK